MKKLIFISMIIFLSFGICFADNDTSTTDYHEYATVDTDPGVTAYGTNEIIIAEKMFRKTDGKVFFSVRGSGVMTVTVQSKCDGDVDWTDEAEYTDNTFPRQQVFGGQEVLFRAIVKPGDWTSGEKRFGWDW